MTEDGYDYNNKRDRNFVYAMTKFTTLANVSFITSMLVYIILLICKYINANSANLYSLNLNGLQIGIKWHIWRHTIRLLRISVFAFTYFESYTPESVKLKRSNNNNNNNENQIEIKKENNKEIKILKIIKKK